MQRGMMGDRASVIFAAPEEARKVATFATSSSVPVRARGVMLAAYSMKLFSASRLAAAFSCAGDGITPGLIALTRMPSPRKSDDHVLAKLRTAAFEPLYTPQLAPPFTPTIQT